MKYFQFFIIFLTLGFSQCTSLKINKEIGVTPDISQYKQDNYLVFQFELTDQVYDQEKLVVRFAHCSPCILMEDI